MDRLPIRMPFGTPVTGSIGEGNGSGFPAIGKGLEGRMGSGFPAAGKRDAGDGSGSKDIGSIDNKNDKLHVACCKFSGLHSAGKDDEQDQSITSGLRLKLVT